MWINYVLTRKCFLLSLSTVRTDTFSLSLHGLTYEDIHRLCSGCTFPQLSFPPPPCVALYQTMSGGHFFFEPFYIFSFCSPSAPDFQSERAQRHSRFCLQSSLTMTSALFVTPTCPIPWTDLLSRAPPQRYWWHVSHNCSCVIHKMIVSSSPATGFRVSH